MAGFGAKYLNAAAIKEEAEDSLPTYEKGGAFSLGGLVKADLSVTYASGDQYSDDRQTEKVDEFISGSLAVEVDELMDETAAKIYGSNYDKTKGKIDNSGDTVPAVGISYYRTLIKNGRKFYRGYYYPKAKAQMGNDSASTKSSSITLTNSPINFSIMEALNGDWRNTMEFDTEKEVKAWCDERLNNNTEDE